MASLAPLLFCAFALEVQVPEGDGWVTDRADLLSAQEEQQLEALMESYKQGSTHEIALLTVPSLEGETIERFALEVAREWGLGSQETSNGALLVVAKQERKLRIEVGRGLEGDLPDVLAGRIVRDVITPAFRRGDFAAGIRDGIVAMHAAIGGDYGPIERSAPSSSTGGGLAALFVLAFVVMLVVLGARKRRGGVRGSSPGALLGGLLAGRALSRGARGWGHGSGGFGGGLGAGGGGFGGFGGGGGFSGGGASGGW